MKHIIYKITNNLNGRYYIGRHSTNNVDDGYMGSGLGIKNAIEKYGVENFTKEIIAEAASSSALWDLERDIVNESVVKDPMSYNMAYGGKHYLDGLSENDQESFKEHQSMAGKKGGVSVWKDVSTEDRSEAMKLRAKNSSRFTGKQTTEEKKRKISESMKNRPRWTCTCGKVMSLLEGNIKQHKTKCKAW